jgi:putative flippase GtrA
VREGESQLCAVYSLAFPRKKRYAVKMVNPFFTRLFRQFMAFLGVGAVATAFDYGVFFLSFWFLGLDPVLAALIGYAAGGALSYVLSRRHVFESERSHRAAVTRFLGVMTGGFLLTGYAMRLFVDGFLLAPLLARILTYGVVLMFNFLAHRFFTFGGR